MSFGWFTFGDTEVANASRTAQLARAMGLSSLRTSPASVQWIEDALVPDDAYAHIQNAPWYDINNSASEEFAGFFPLAVEGLYDSTGGATVLEHIGDGGSVGSLRASTASLVWSGALLASTEAGLDYGLRWLKHALSRPDFGGPSRIGPALTYFAHTPAVGEWTPPIVHRNRVKLTRAISVTRRTSGLTPTRKGALALVTFTMTAGDPYEYGESVLLVEDIGGTPSGAALVTDDSVVLTEGTCPTFDYTPVYDPANPALVTPPAPPNLIPAGWTLAPGQDFTRFYAEVAPVSPVALSQVPVVTLRSATEARMVRVTINPVTDPDVSVVAAIQCGYGWTAVVSYLPPDVDLVIDGENERVYTQVSGTVRLADSLVYSPDAKPIQWDSLNGSQSLPGRGFVVSVDAFEKAGGGYEGDGDLRVSLALVAKSD